MQLWTNCTLMLLSHSKCFHGRNFSLSFFVKKLDATSLAILLQVPKTICSWPSDDNPPHTLYPHGYGFKQHWHDKHFPHRKSTLIDPVTANSVWCNSHSAVRTGDQTNGRHEKSNQNQWQVHKVKMSSYTVYIEYASL